MPRRLALALALAACSAPSYSRAPSRPAYSALPSAPSLRETGPYREALAREEQRLRAGAPPAAAALHDAVEQIVTELGQACTPRNPGGDGLHWTVSCATQTLFAPGSSAASPEVVQRWRAVGRIVGDLLRRQLPGAQRLRVAVSGFADHIQFASPATATACDALKTAFRADYPAPADDAARNRELSFCRAANMAREIACATLPGGCTGAAVSHAPGLSVGVFGGGTTALDANPAGFNTRVETPSGTLECPCHPVAPNTLGPSWASQHGRPWNIPACPAPVADAPVLFDCADARRVELDLWLDVTAAQRSPDRCELSASDPDARALACLQQAVGASSHQAALQAPTPGAREDRCAAAPNPLGWYAGRSGDAPPCAAEVGR